MSHSRAERRCEATAEFTAATLLWAHWAVVLLFFATDADIHMSRKFYDWDLGGQAFDFAMRLGRGSVVSSTERCTAHLKIALTASVRLTLYKKIMGGLDVIAMT
jgi:hypothetical protein